MSQKKKVNHLLENTKKTGKRWQETKKERLYEEKRGCRVFSDSYKTEVMLDGEKEQGRAEEGAQVIKH
jgi:hypothetical protein